MCIFDTIKRTKGWKEDPNLSFNDNLFFGSVHFVQVFFGKYRVVRHNNDDFDDLAADCSIEVYESAKRNIDKWDREKWRLDQYLYGRAWSIVGNFLRKRFGKKSREPLDVKIADNRLTSVEYDVGTDEISSSNYAQGTRYVVFRPTPLTYYEKKLSEAALQWLEYRDECIDMGIDYEDAEDWLTNKNSKDTDLKYLGKILNEESPSKTANKKCRKPSLD